MPDTTRLTVEFLEHEIDGAVVLTERDTTGDEIMRGIGYEQQIRTSEKMTSSS